MEQNDKEIIEFNQIYKDYVKKMNSREFATLIIKFGGLNARISIIKQIVELGIKIPKRLELEMAKYENKLNPIELFFEFEHVDNTEHIDYIYQKFLIWFNENNFLIYTHIPLKNDLKYYIQNQQNINRLIGNLTDDDCHLMKWNHIA